MQNQIASAYGIAPDEVAMDVDYVATGTLKVDIPDDMTEDEAIDALTDAIR